MNQRERFVNYLLGNKVDRTPFFLFWEPWNTTMKKWEKEGPLKFKKNKNGLLTAGTSIIEYFGSDHSKHSIGDGDGVFTGPFPVRDKKILEENDESYTYINNWGIKLKDFKKKESMPMFLEFPIKNKEDWARFKQERLDPDQNERFEKGWEDRIKKWSNEEYPIWMGNYPNVGLFGGLRWLLGDEECLISFYTQPDLVKDILDYLTTFYIEIFKKIVKRVKVDVLHMWEDMCSRNGPLISPKHWEEFIGPNYRRLKKFMKEHNIKIFSVDTDGNVEQIIMPMIKSGVNLLLPMEVAAGNDVNLYREKYPELAMIGGIDKRVLSEGPGAIDRELRRIEQAVKKGKYIPTLDHLIPDNVPWENYKYYAGALRDLIFHSKK